MSEEKHSFQAKTNQVLDLLTHSVYSNKGVFIRELVSNASDALQKTKLQALQDTDYLDEDEELKIQIIPHEDEGKLVIKDNGIGMSKEDVKKNIGTIAQSGTQDFLDKLKEAKEKGEDNLIGQFGIGFYSVFMVADKVQVDTKAHNEKAVRWISDGKDNYKIKDSDKENRGTKITIYLDDDSKEFGEENKVKSLIKKHSNYVSFPIELLSTKTIETDEEKENDSEESEKETKQEFEQVNQTKAIWNKRKANIDKDEYIEFFKSMTNNQNDPLGWSHLNVEGLLNYNSLLYIPSKAQFGLKDPNQDYGPKLYIQNVMVLEKAKQLLPVWLRFVEGVVETKDLPLNISREMLQDNKTIAKIKSSLTKKIVKKLKKLAKNEPKKYNVFLEDYGKILKEGIHYDKSRKGDIAELLKFHSLNKDKKIFLEDYVENMNEDQEKIYYLIGKSVEQMKNSPYLESFKKDDIDVLLLDEPIDNWVVQGLMEYDETPLVSVQSDQASSDESGDNEEDETDMDEDLLEFIKDSIGEDKIAEVKVSNSVENTPALLVRKQGAPSAQMQQLMQNMNQYSPNVKKILKLNKNSKVVQKMEKAYQKDDSSSKLDKIVDYLYSQAVLNEGGQIDNMNEFLQTVNEFADSYLED